MLAQLVVVGLFFAASAHGNSQFGQTVSRSVQIQAVGAPWPKPRSMAVQDVRFALAGPAMFRFRQASDVPCLVLEKAFTRYFNLIFFGRPEVSLRRQMTVMKRWGVARPWPMNMDVLTGLSVTIQDCSEAYPALSSIEKYMLEVSSPTATISAPSVWGALRGLETFSQLLYQAPEAMLVVNKTLIVDFPRFAHRGFLLDTSRHFLSMSVILEFLDAMAYNKMNVFHWHIVDDQSFPYESEVFPIMSQQGAYSPSHVYSRDDVQRVIDYARDRGIRVLPEFDTPGHTQSWRSIKGLLTPCQDQQGKNTGTTGPINPILNTTYSFLGAFFKEVQALFPDDFIHVGGDEVNFSCWKSNKDIQQFMTQMGFGKNYSKLEAYYEKRFLDIVTHLSATPIVWQEVVDNGVEVSLDTVVHVWKQPWASEMYNVTKKGYRSLLSTPWYLNLGGNPYSHPWRATYVVEPLKFNGTKAQEELVFGGEACMWGEYADNTNVIQRSWPRGCAVAERLWSDKSVRNVTEAATRIAEQRCRMVRRGLKAEPVTGPGFCPSDPDS